MDFFDRLLDGNGAFGRFKRVLANEEKDWLKAWYGYRYDCLWEEMLRWIEELPFSVQRQIDYADNCKVCQAMKKAESEGRTLPKNELKSAFDKASHSHPSIPLS